MSKGRRGIEIWRVGRTGERWCAGGCRFRGMRRAGRCSREGERQALRSENGRLVRRVRRRALRFWRGEGAVMECISGLRFSRGVVVAIVNMPALLAAKQEDVRQVVVIRLVQVALRPA